MADSAHHKQDLLHERHARLQHALSRGIGAIAAAVKEGGLAPLPAELGRRALAEAVGFRMQRLVDLLLVAGADPNLADDRGETPIYSAITYGTERSEIVKSLLAAGANPNGQPGKRPIWEAAFRGDLTGLDMLLAAAASTDVKNQHGATLLHIAVEFGRTGVVQRLLEIGLPIDARDFTGNTPLHYAAHSDSGTLPVVSLLIGAGADVDARSSTGITPALEAAGRGHMTMFAELISRGADPLARDNEGRGAFGWTWNRTRESEALLILQKYPGAAPAGDTLDQAFVEAVRLGQTNLAKKLADLGADLGQKHEGRSLLQCAPRRAEELKRWLRSLKSSASIVSAMGDSSDAVTPASSFPTSLTL